MSQVKSKMSQDGNTLILEIDVSPAARKAAGPSKSGKTRVLASTNGFTRFGDVGVSLNATIPLEG